MTKIDFFEEFSKHYRPEFIRPAIRGYDKGNKVICGGDVNCLKCAMDSHCSDGVCVFSQKEIEDLQEQYPEYFI